MHTFIIILPNVYGWPLATSDLHFLRYSPSHAITPFIVMCAGVHVCSLFNVHSKFSRFFFLLISICLCPRFKSRLVRRLASFSFIIRNCLTLGITIYTPCVALNIIAGIPDWASLTTMTLLTILFTITVSQLNSDDANVTNGIVFECLHNLQVCVCVCALCANIRSTHSPLISVSTFVSTCFLGVL